MGTPGSAGPKRARKRSRREGRMQSLLSALVCAFVGAVASGTLAQGRAKALGQLFELNELPVHMGGLRPLRVAFTARDGSTPAGPAVDHVLSLLETLEDHVRVDEAGELARGAAPRCVGDAVWSAEELSPRRQRFAGSCKEGILAPLCADGTEVPPHLWARQLVCLPDGSGHFQVRGCYVGSPGLSDPSIAEADAVIFLDDSTTPVPFAEGDPLAASSTRFPLGSCSPHFNRSVVVLHADAVQWWSKRAPGSRIAPLLLSDGSTASLLGLPDHRWPLSPHFRPRREDISFVMDADSGSVFLHVGHGIHLSDAALTPSARAALLAALTEEQEHEEEDEQQQLLLLTEQKQGGKQVGGGEGVWGGRRLQGNESSNSTESVDVGTNSTETSNSTDPSVEVEEAVPECTAGLFVYRFSRFGREDRVVENVVDGNATNVTLTYECTADCTGLAGPGVYSDVSTGECRPVCDGVEVETAAGSTNETYLQPFYLVGAGLPAVPSAVQLARAQALCVAECPAGSVADDFNRTCKYVCPAGFALDVGGTTAADCVSPCAAPVVETPAGAESNATVNATVNATASSNSSSSSNTTTTTEEEEEAVVVLGYAAYVEFPLHRACYATNCTTNGTFYNLVTGLCVDSCGAGTVAHWGARECRFVCPSDTYLTAEGQRLAAAGRVGEASQECVAACPFGETETATSRTCTPLCRPGLVLPPTADEVVNGTVTTIEGDNGCVDADCCVLTGCPAGFAASAARVCESVCGEDDPSYVAAGVVSATAVARTTTALAALVSASAQCVESCPTASIGSVPNNQTGVCEPLCASGTRLSADNARWLAETDPVSAAEVNVTALCSASACSYGQLEVSSARACIFTCGQTGQDADEDAATTYLSPEGRTDLYASPVCLAACPRGYNGSATSRVCEPLCNSSQVILPGTTNCSDSSCPTGYHIPATATVSRVCAPICPAGKVLPDQGSMVSDCVTTCPAGEKEVTGERRCVVACAADKYLPPNPTGVSSCVYASGCPYGTFATASSQRCEQVCPSGSLLPPNLESLLVGSARNRTAAEESCVSSCPSVTLRGVSGEYTEVDSLHRACTLRCSANTYLSVFPDTDGTASCVSTCGRGTAPDVTTRVCQPACPEDERLDLDGVCRGNCSVGIAPSAAGTGVGNTTLAVCLLNSSAGPVWSFPSNETSFEVPESTGSGHFVGPTFTSYASDADGANDTLEFFVVGGSGFGVFVVEDPLVGRLSLGSNVTLNFERSAAEDDDDDSSTGPLYSVVVAAVDGNGHVALVELSARVTDSNEAPTVVASYEEALLARGFSVAANGRFTYGQRSDTLVIPAGTMIRDVDANDTLVSATLGTLSTLTYTLEWYNTENSQYEALSTLETEFALGGGSATLSLIASPTRGVDEYRLVGTPYYDGAARLNQSNPFSPSPRSIRFRLTGEDAAGLNVATTFTIAVVIAGCRSPAAAYSATTNPQGNYNAVATVDDGSCVFPPLTVTPAAGGTVSVPGADGDSAGEGSAELSFPAGAVSSNVVVEAKGASALVAAGLVDFGRGAVFSSRGTLQTGAGSGGTAADEVRIPGRGRTTTVLTSRMLQLTPEGTVFAQPVTVTFVLGELPSGATATILTASRVGSGAYGTLEPLADCQVTASTGQVSCKLSHFSVIVPATIVLDSTAGAVTTGTRPGAGGCPLSCHGHGRCTSHGRCECHPGWRGYSCGDRECPQGPSWGLPTGSSVDASPGVVLAECSGRGTCNRATGVCQCSPGFAGASCSRMTCPVQSSAADEASAIAASLSSLATTSHPLDTAPMSSGLHAAARRALLAGARPDVVRGSTRGFQSRGDLRRLASLARGGPSASSMAGSFAVVTGAGAFAGDSPAAVGSASSPLASGLAVAASALLGTSAPPCSGHGRCMPIQHVPGQRGDGLSVLVSNAGGSTGWDVARIQSCVCDPGFMGPDCSARQCPVGDDPLSPCSRDDPYGGCSPDDHARVWTLSVTLPTAPLADSDVTGTLAVRVGSPQTGSLTTPRFHDPSGADRGLWELGLNGGALAVSRALSSLPDEVLSTVSVSLEERSTLVRSWSVTLTGPEASGNGVWLRCPPRMGCDHPGCSPRFAPLLLVDTSLSTAATPSHLRLSEGVVPDRSVAQSHSDAEFDFRAIVTVSHVTVLSRSGATAGSNITRAVYSVEVVTPSSGTTTLVNAARGPVPLGRAAAVTADDTSGSTPGGSTFGSSGILPSGQGARHVPLGAADLFVDFLVDLPDEGSYVWLISSASCSTSLTREAHPRYERAECSGRGACDRATGQCQCLPGFSASDCGTHVLET